MPSSLWHPSHVDTYADDAGPMAADDAACPRCHGSGREMVMERGSWIVCRECSGSGRAL